MILDKRAKHLSSYGNHKGAVDDYLQSLRLCERISGSTHPQTLILMNDLATTYVHMNDVENAVTYLKKAISGGIKTESEDLATFYFNLGTIYLRQNDANQAEVVCRESFSLATKAEDYPLIGKSKECLQKARKAQ